MNRAALVAALAATYLASACQGNAGATPVAAPDKPFGDRIVLQPGMTADLAPATTLAFERIVSDSRCPKDAQCIWAGEVTVAMKLVTPLGSNSFELSDRNDKVSALGYSIELLEYGLCPGGPAITPLPGECAQLKVGADPAP